MLNVERLLCRRTRNDMSQMGISYSSISFHFLVEIKCCAISVLQVLVNALEIRRKRLMSLRIIFTDV